MPHPWLWVSRNRTPTVTQWSLWASPQTARRSCPVRTTKRSKSGVQVSALTQNHKPGQQHFLCVWQQPWSSRWRSRMRIPAVLMAPFHQCSSLQTDPRSSVAASRTRRSKSGVRALISPVAALGAHLRVPAHRFVILDFGCISVGQRCWRVWNS